MRIKSWYEEIRGLLTQHWRQTLLFCIGGLLTPLIAVQLLYPSNALLPLTSVDGINLSGWNKAAAVVELDDKYAQKPINIFFGVESAGVYATPKPADLGITVSNEQRLAAMNYPWYLRLVPGSLWWGHFVVGPSSSPDYTRDDTKLADYIVKQWGVSCSLQPKNANLKVTDGVIVVERGNVGGTCNIGDVTKTLSSLQMSLTSDVGVVIPATNIIPIVIDNVQAEHLARNINRAIEKGIDLNLDEEKFLLPRDQLISWLDFSVSDGKLGYSFNIDRATNYLNEQLAGKTAKPAGTTIVSTYNFVETSRQTGHSGQILNIAGTLANIKDYIDGKTNEANVGVLTVDPEIQYERNFSQTNEGLSSLISNFAATHAGTYGVVLSELSGQYRRATYNSTKSFTTASTYKLFVAYSTLRRIEAGTWQWSDQIYGGRNLTKCFDDMIVLSDNNCAAALLAKIGYTAITKEAHDIGCVNTSFLGSDAIKSTPEDLALLLGELQIGQILTQQSSRDTLINAMRRSIYRRGIPAGETGTVANKVGFLDSLLHDAAIVYSSTGPYVLVIMTDGSNWPNIAELTRQLEALRIQ